MSPPSDARPLPLPVLGGLAAASGAVALAYEVGFTRELALLAGGHIEAVSAVLVAFFGGLALGSRVFGPRADAVARPLLLYGLLEAGAAGFALGALALLGALRVRAAVGGPLALAAGAALVLPVTVLLGGTLPALVRAATASAARAPLAAGRLLGANTAGSVAGVLLAAFAIPLAGLGWTLVVAAAGGLAVAGGAAALALARARSPAGEAEPAFPYLGGGKPVPGAVLAAAALAGATTLAYEVVITRAATLRMGSTLLAWTSVLGLFLAGLAMGYASLSGAAARSRRPAIVLGGLELGLAACIAVGAWVLGPPLARPAVGLSPSALLSVAVGVLPPAFLMGGAFPFLLRVALGRAAPVGRGVGRIAAANTGGGLVGALAAPFLLLPYAGLQGAAVACAAPAVLLAAAFVAAASSPGRQRAARAGVVLAAGVAFAAAPLLRPPRAPGDAHVLFVEPGRQATAVVLHWGDRRELVVDGDPEASTAGPSRRTEELLARLPLSLHPAPQRLLEVGLGSGITLATAHREGVPEIVCVEIARSVVRAARFFAPQNDPVTAAPGRSLRLVHGDGRVYLARHPREWDVVVANTVHPWSVGATGLYSREYFTRMAAALRPGGLAVQWMPLDRIGAESFAAILRTFFHAFPEGGVYWGAGNVLLVGGHEVPQAPRAGAPLPDVASRHVAGAADVRAVLGAEPLLSDERPLLELRAALARAGGASGEPIAPLLRIAERAHARRSERSEPRPLLLFLRARAARKAGEQARAEGFEARAARAGFAPARRARARAFLDEARAALRAGRHAEAARAWRHARAEAPGHPAPGFGLGLVALEQGKLGEAERRLQDQVGAHPGHAEAWNLLGVVRERRGETEGARRAFAAALRSDPFFPAALANAGLAAATDGDLEHARVLLRRLRAASPLGDAPELRALRRAVRKAEGRRRAAG